jgi:hypothetical protein
MSYTHHFRATVTRYSVPAFGARRVNPIDTASEVVCFIEKTATCWLCLVDGLQSIAIGHFGMVFNTPSLGYNCVCYRGSYAGSVS